MGDFRRRPARPTRTALAALAALCLAAIAGMVGIAGCSAASGDAGPSSSAELTTPGSSDASADDAAIRRTINAINATAGGPVSAQRTILEQSVDASQRQSQQNCPTATSTLLFEPAYAALRRAPQPAVDGATYLLPSLIKIYDGDRIVGTDLTTLRLWMAHGTVTTAALCVA